MPEIRAKKPFSDWRDSEENLPLEDMSKAVNLMLTAILEHLLFTGNMIVHR